MTTEDRLARLRADRGDRRRPAQTSKIVAAGVTTTAVLGLTAAFGWSAAAGSASPPPAEPVLLASVDQPVVTVPAGLQPVPATNAPVAVAIPAPRPAPTAPRASAPVRTTPPAASSSGSH